MYPDPNGMRRRIHQIVETFRQKGATSPETAMTIQELGLPPRFEQAMHRRLGQTDIFVEVNGKYYLDEARLKQFREQHASVNAGGGGDASGSGRPTWSRAFGIFLMLPIGIIVALFLVYYFVYMQSAGYFPGEILLILLIVMLVLFALRMLFWRRRRF